MGECGLTAALVAEGMKGGAGWQITVTCPAVWDRRVWGDSLIKKKNGWMRINKSYESTEVRKKKKNLLHE